MATTIEGKCKTELHNLRYYNPVDPGMRRYGFGEEPFGLRFSRIASHALLGCALQATFFYLAPQIATKVASFALPYVKQVSLIICAAEIAGLVAVSEYGNRSLSGRRIEQTLIMFGAAVLQAALTAHIVAMPWLTWAVASALLSLVCHLIESKYEQDLPDFSIKTVAKLLPSLYQQKPDAVSSILTKAANSLSQGSSNTGERQAALLLLTEALLVKDEKFAQSLNGILSDEANELTTENWLIQENSLSIEEIKPIAILLTSLMKRELLTNNTVSSMIRAASDFNSISRSVAYILTAYRTLHCLKQKPDHDREKAAKIASNLLKAYARFDLKSGKDWALELTTIGCEVAADIYKTLRDNTVDVSDGLTEDVRKAYEAALKLSSVALSSQRPPSRNKPILLPKPLLATPLAILPGLLPQEEPRLSERGLTEREAAEA